MVCYGIFWSGQLISYGDEFKPVGDKRTMRLELCGETTWFHWCFERLDVISIVFKGVNHGKLSSTC